jgi:hypothetical protein
MRSRLIVAVAVLAMSRPSFGQQASDIASIEAAAAGYAMTHFAKGAMALDTTNIYLRPSGQSGPGRSRAELAQLSQVLKGAKVGALSDFRVCSHPGNANACELHGADAVLSMSRPTIKGDNAVVMVQVFTANRTSNGQWFSGSRTERVQLVKQGAQWIVTGVLGGGSVS